MIARHPIAKLSVSHCAVAPRAQQRCFVLTDGRSRYIGHERVRACVQACRLSPAEARLGLLARGNEVAQRFRRVLGIQRRGLREVDGESRRELLRLIAPAALERVAHLSMHPHTARG
jgi:hypothetical protein